MTDTLNNPQPQSPKDFNVDQLVDLTFTVFPDLLPDEEFPEYDGREVLGLADDDFLAANHREFFLRDDVVIKTAEDKDRNILGYALAIPISVFDRTRANDSETAYVYYTAVQPELQGQGLIWGIKKELFGDLFRKGFRFIEIDASEEHGYAEKMSQLYEDNLVEQSTGRFEEYVGEKQRFMRIELTPHLLGTMAVEAASEQ